MENKKKIRVLKSREDTETDKILEKVMDGEEDNSSIASDYHEPHHDNHHETHHDNFGGSRHEKHRKNRIIVVTCAMVFTMLLAVVVGCGLALWDMGKTPADLIAAITNSSDNSASKAAASDDGLNFVDANEEASESEDDGLTFIDANDTEEESDKEASGEDSKNASEGSDAEEGEQPDAMITNDDGTVVVSSELAGVASIMRAGQEEAMIIATAAQSNITSPDSGYPLPFTTVDESYFNDALFIGDSRFYGFCMWSGIPGANYCATSFNILNYETFKAVQTGNGKVPIFSAMPYNAFTKIYIKVGLNEMGTNEARFEAVYAEVIAKLRQMQPRAIIYIHGVLPVTAAKSASDKTHNNPNILARNASLAQFAAQQQCYYIDAGPVLSDASGCLRPEMTSDGIHLASAYMGVWKQYLMEHAVVVQ